MSSRTKLQRIVLYAALLTLFGCAEAPKQLYMWETFPQLQYNALLREGASPEEQILAMESHAEKARGAGAELPPGFRAHLGLLHLAKGDASTARQMWQAEKLAFPESTPYMDQLLKRLDGSNATASKEKPA